MNQTIPSGTIEINGLVAVLKTFGLGIIGSIVAGLIAIAFNVNYGMYAAIAIPVITAVSHFLTVWLGTYDIQVPPSTTPTATENSVPQV